MTQVARAFVFVDYETPEWLMVAASEYQRLKNLGLHAQFVFLSELNSPPTKTLNGRKLLFRHFNLKPSSAIKFNPHCLQGARHEDFSLSKRAIAALDGQLIAYFRNSSPKGFFARSMRRNLEKNSLTLQRWLRQEFSEHTVRQVSCPNGRLFLHQVIRDVCREFQVSMNFTETAFIDAQDPVAYYLDEFPVHDRIAFYQKNKAEFDSFSNLQEEAFEREQKWFFERSIPRSGSNEFTKRFKGSEGELSEESESSAVIFTSSSDEFINLDPAQWPDGNVDQYDSYRNVLSNLPRTMHVSVRIHPNLLNKATGHFMCEVKLVRALKRDFPHLTILWPGDTANSYDLARRASLVIVSQSTMGLEALLMGKAVISTMANSWNLFFGSQWDPKRENYGVKTSKTNVYAFMKLFNSGAKGALTVSHSDFASASRFPCEVWRLYWPSHFYFRLARLVNIQIDRVLRKFCR